MMDRLAFWLAWKLPRRLVYWCAVRLIAHASHVLASTEMNAITPSDALKAWDAPLEQGSEQ